MEMTAKVTIRGAKAFRGNIDGKDLDSGKIYVDTELKGENSWGVCTQELKCDGGDMVRAIKHNPFPFIAEIGLQEMSNGTVTTKVVTSIKPLNRIDEAQTKAAKA